MEKNNVLVVDDDKEIVDAIDIYLRNEGINVIKAYDGLEALEALMENDVYLILMDIMMPNMDGLRTTMKIRKEKNIPIILISAKSEDTDKILGLNMGADDYITKPFSYKLLLKRVEAVLRRAKIEQKESYIEFEKIKLNLKTYSVEIDDESVDLTLKEFKILKSLIQNYPQVVTREKLLDSIWGYDYFGDTRIVDAHIKNIRKKIKLPYIKTVKGIGYTLKKDI